MRMKIENAIRQLKHLKNDAQLRADDINAIETAIEALIYKADMECRPLMRDCHYSKKLDKYIDAYVRVTLIDDTVQEGYFHYETGYYYTIERDYFETNDAKRTRHKRRRMFRKNKVKHIEEIENRCCGMCKHYEQSKYFPDEWFCKNKRSKCYDKRMKYGMECKGFKEKE